MPPTTSMKGLTNTFRGEIYGADHPEYDSARAVYNAMIDKRPKAVARCADVADVIAAVNFARKHGLAVAVRGGGHSGPGFGVCDDGLVIDLSAMRNVRVDPTAGTARAAGGCVTGDLDHATHAFGLATPTGVISTTGLGGLTLGGGHGYLTRKYGLTIDNLIEADLVLADGSFVTVNERHYPDLFWAIRGGGGNFGVATSFLFRLHPVGVVHAGPTLWPVEEAGQVLAWYREFMLSARVDLYGFFAFMVVPSVPIFPKNLHGKTVCGCVWCYTGPEQGFKDALAPVLERKPVFEHVGPVPYPALQSMFDQFYPPGLQWYWKGDFVKEIPDEAIAVHSEHGPRLHPPLSTMHLYPINGAAHRFTASDTAFGYRDANWSMVITGVDPEPKNADRIRDWSRGYWEALSPYTMGGSYVNFLMEEGESRVKGTYRENFSRLVTIKRKYDPKNFFRVNQNIDPST